MRAGILRWTAAGLLLAGAGVTSLRGSDVQTVRGVRYPQYDDKGNMTSQMFGDLARILPNGIIEIGGLTMEVYRDGEVDMRVTAPECRFDQRGQRAGSVGEIRIVRENLVVTGTGYRWEGREETFTIYTNVRVVVREAPRTAVTGEER